MEFLQDIAIRPYAVADATVVWQAVRESMGDLQPWMPWCHRDYSLRDSCGWLELQVKAFEQRTAFEFAIVSADGGYLGACGINQIDQPNHRANLGYWVRTSACRRGIATRAVRLIREWAFRNTDLSRLEIVVAVGNVASQRVAEKAGASREGVLKHRIFLHGVPHDAVMFSFT